MRAIQETVSPEDDDEETAEPWAASASLGGTSYEEVVGCDDDDDDDDEEGDDEEDEDAEPHFPLVIGAVLRFPENREVPARLRARGRRPHARHPRGTRDGRRREADRQPAGRDVSEARRNGRLSFSRRARRALPRHEPSSDPDVCRLAACCRRATSTVVGDLVSWSVDTKGTSSHSIGSSTEEEFAHVVVDRDGVEWAVRETATPQPWARAPQLSRLNSRECVRRVWRYPSDWRELTPTRCCGSAWPTDRASVPRGRETGAPVDAYGCTTL